MDSCLLDVKSVSEILGIDDVALVSLVNSAETRQLVVACDLEMRDLIMKYMADKPETQKLFPSVVSDILGTRDKSSLEVRIFGLKDGVYQTEIYDQLTQRSFPIRCSDGIFFAIVCKLHIYASAEVMRCHSIPYETFATKVGLPLTVLSDKLLKDSLQKAIETENYEMASNLRDELNKRHKDKHE